jgi:hypothetical protein
MKTLSYLRLVTHLKFLIVGWTGTWSRNGLIIGLRLTLWNGSQGQVRPENDRERPELKFKFLFLGFIVTQQWVGWLPGTKPYKFIGCGAMDVTKPYKLIGFVAMDVTKSYKFIGCGAMDVAKPDGPWMPPNPINS